MARGLNKVMLIGNLGGDPDTRYTANGGAITTISIATSESWTDKQTGQKVEKTEWHRVKFFGKLAEIASEYLKKGRQVYVEGKLTHGKYTDKEGIERYTTDIICDNLQMLGGAPGGDRGEREEREPRRQQSRERGGMASRGGGEERASAPRAQTSNPAPSTFDDDDIPF